MNLKYGMNIPHNIPNFYSTFWEFKFVFIQVMMVYSTFQKKYINPNKTFQECINIAYICRCRYTYLVIHLIIIGVVSAITVCSVRVDILILFY